MTLSYLWLIAVVPLAAALWKFRYKPPAHPIVGETAYVGSNGLTKSEGGEVTCAGSIRKAQLAAHAKAEQVEAGALVTIVGVSGVTLIVQPRAGGTS